MMIEQLTDHERFELRTSNFYWPEFEDQPSEALEAHISEILRDTVAKATLLCELIGDTVVYPAVYSKKFPRALNRLVESLDRTLARHVPGLRVSRAKSTMAMLLAVVEIADPSVSGGSVEEAVKRLGQARGGYAPKPGSNPPQNSGRKSKRTQ
jgi:hypothetical protein